MDCGLLPSLWKVIRKPKLLSASLSVLFRDLPLSRKHEGTCKWKIGRGLLQQGNSERISLYSCKFQYLLLPRAFQGLMYFFLLEHHNPWRASCPPATLAVVGQALVFTHCDILWKTPGTPFFSLLFVKLPSIKKKSWNSGLLYWCFERYLQPVLTFRGEPVVQPVFPSCSLVLPFCL